MISEVELFSKVHLHVLSFQISYFDNSAASYVFVFFRRDDVIGKYGTHTRHDNLWTLTPGRLDIMPTNSHQVITGA